MGSRHCCDRQAAIRERTAAMASLMLLLLLWADVAVSTGVDLQKRVIGGEPCQRRYHVKLRVSNALCGGSLIGDRWILTAAHCVREGSAVFAEYGEHPEDREVQIKAKPVVYRGKDNNTRHDIMLLQLPTPSGIKPVALPDCKSPLEIVSIAGHAATSGGPNDERKPGVSPTLHCADIKLVSCDDLKNTLQDHFKEVYQVKKDQHWFCGQATGKDICYGDSGEGAVHEDKIYGVVSFLGDPNYVCRKAAAFMDLCNKEYAEWIRTTIN